MVEPQSSSSSSILAIAVCLSSSSLSVSIRSIPSCFLFYFLPALLLTCIPTCLVVPCSAAI
jgi:hypothetical protein